jgi:hypothetical protein
VFESAIFGSHSTTSTHHSKTPGVERPARDRVKEEEKKEGEERRKKL